MNLLFVNSQPLILPQDKQRELADALADLLLHAATGTVDPDEKGELA